MTDPSRREVICPACSTPGSGRFCSSCGAALEGSVCAGCKSPLSPGARFCHKCGKPAGQGAAAAVPAVAQSRSAAPMPMAWMVITIAVVALLAFLAGGASKTSPAPRVDMTQAPLRAPDISQLSPQERADRLFNRVMLLAGQGKTDSVLFFAPMAISAYQMLSPMNADQRYDMGRVAEVAGALTVARAQADTILKENPSHLLGLVLGARVASLEKDAALRSSYESRVLAAYDSETAKRLPEYERHAADIASVLADARRSAARTR